MIHRFPSRLAAACAACTAAVAGAQTQAAPPAVAPATTYRSTFEGYQPFNDQPVGVWKDANDAVGRIGGWRAYAKEAQEAQGKPAEAPAAAPAQPPGHKH
jgi:hypothetical protein